MAWKVTAQHTGVTYQAGQQLTRRKPCSHLHAAVLSVRNARCTPTPAAATIARLAGSSATPLATVRLTCVGLCSYLVFAVVCRLRPGDDCIRHSRQQYPAPRRLRRCG